MKFRKIGKREAKARKENTRVWDLFKSMMNSPAAISFAAEHGTNAVIPGWGFTYAEIDERYNAAEAQI